MESTEVEHCHYCKRTQDELPEGEEFRPYGPGGSQVCYDCATETPEREKQTRAAFEALLEATAAIAPQDEDGISVVIVHGNKMVPTNLANAMEAIQKMIREEDL